MLAQPNLWLPGMPAAARSKAAAETHGGGACDEPAIGAASRLSKGEVDELPLCCFGPGGDYRVAWRPVRSEAGRDSHRALRGSLRDVSDRRGFVEAAVSSLIGTWLGRLRRIVGVRGDARLRVEPLENEFHPAHVGVAAPACESIEAKAKAALAGRGPVVILGPQCLHG